MSEETVSDWPRLPQLHAFARDARELGYDIKDPSSTAAFQVFTISKHTPVGFSIALHEKTRRLHVAASVRGKYFIESPRSDWNSVFTTAFALMSRAVSGVSVAWIYEEGFVPGEIDDGMVSLEQPEPTLPATEDGLLSVIRLMRAAVLACRALQCCEDPDHPEATQPTESRADESPDWAMRMLKRLKRDTSSILVSRRLCPSWKTWYDSSDGASFLHAPLFVERMRSCFRDIDAKRLKGVTGELSILPKARLFVAAVALDAATEILAAARDAAGPEEIIPIPFENWLVCLGASHAVWLPSDCGRFAFEAERDRIHQRHQDESELLFPPSDFEWAAQIPDDMFENLVCELLGREPGVTRIRRAGPTRQGDKGRDQIADWYTNVRSAADLEANRSLEPTSVIVQVKALRERVGKGSVRDIRDTVEHHGGQGYFLAVASELTAPLIEQLETLKRERGWFIDWWTRLEIEQRLRRHSDVRERYPMVVTVRSATPNAPDR